MRAHLVTAAFLRLLLSFECSAEEASWFGFGESTPDPNGRDVEAILVMRGQKKDHFGAKKQKHLCNIVSQAVRVKAGAVKITSIVDQVACIGGCSHLPSFIQMPTQLEVGILIHTDMNHVKTMAQLVVDDHFFHTVSKRYGQTVTVKVNSVKAEKDVTGNDEPCKQSTTYSHWSECSPAPGARGKPHCHQHGVRYRLRKKSVCKAGSNVPMVMKFTQKGRCKTMDC